MMIYLKNPLIYGILGFILVSTPCLYFFFAGFPGTRVSETWNQTESGIKKTIVTETVWIGAFPKNWMLSFMKLVSDLSER